jgi:nucleoside-diphosphate-sugar epimerase
MSVLITGGCGLIGSTLARMLVARGESVAVFDQAPAPWRFTGIEDKVRTIRGQLGTFSHVLEAFTQVKPSVVFHLGAMLSTPANDDPPGAFEANVQGTFHVLEAARLSGVERVRFTSTMATYGIDIGGPTIGQNTLQRPTTLYGTTKVFGELLGRFYGTRYGLDFRAVRFPSVIGPGATSRHMSIYNAWAVEKAILGEPYDIFVEKHVRCAILYYKDAARSLVVLDAAPRESAKAVCYTLAGIEPVPSAGDLAAAITAAFPKARIGFKPDAFAMAFHEKLQGLSYDESTARSELGWELQYTMPRMIEDFAEELRSHPERYGRKGS